MQTSNPGNPVKGSLTETISELEALIPEQQSVASDIPILDELVEAEDVDINEWGQHLELPSGTTDQMLHMIDRIEHRLTDELETLVQTLKSTMKDSIIKELKTRLETAADNATSRNELAGDKPD